MFIKAAAIILLAAVIILLLYEIWQCANQRLYYLQDWTNSIDVILYICTIVFATSAFGDCMCPASWQWQVGCVAVFLAWIDLLIFLRMLPLGS